MNKYSLKTKLIGGFILSTIITIIVGLAGFYGVASLQSDLNEVGVVRLPSILGLEILNEAQTAIDSSENALLVMKLDAKGREEQYQRIESAWKRVDQGWKIYEPLPQTKEEERLWSLFVPAWEAYKKDHQKYIALCHQLDTATKGRGFDAAKDSALYDTMIQQALVENGKTFAAAESLLGQIIDLNIKVAEEAQKQAATDAAFAKWLAGLGMAFGAIIGISLGFYLASSITNPIKVVADQLSSGAAQTSAASSQVSAASQSLAEGASEQAASLEETSASMEEIASMSKQNTGNAEKANDLASQTRSAADLGAEEMSQMLNAMDAIKTSSSDISKIIKTIDEIAFQTNILALNAAVEAARAGEAGMGFAVVADEVRNLAQRSAMAAKETATKIEEAINKSNHGVQISTKVAARLQEIVEKARQVDELIKHITQASKEQTQGVDQVNLALNQMDKVTQSSAANAEESAAASEELNAQALTLMESVHTLMELVEGEGNVQREATLHHAPISHLSKSTGFSPKTSSPKAPARLLTPVKPQEEPPRSRLTNKKEISRKEIPMGESFKDIS